MSWFGKLLCGTVGFVFGGPIGSVGGVALGHLLIDEKRGSRKSNTESATTPDSILHGCEESQAIFFITTFSLMARLAKADGVICRDEIKAVERIMQDELGMDVKSRNFAKQVFSVARNSAADFDDYAAQFLDNFSHNRRILLCLVDLLLKLAAADGEYHDEEERLICHATELFAITDEEYDALRARHLNESDRHYKILHSKRGDSISEIEQKYQFLIEEYDPDRIVRDGLPPEFVAFARRKLTDIEDAYRRVRDQANV